VNVKIDWISFTLPTVKRIGYDLDALTASIKEQLYNTDAPALYSLFEGFEWSLEAGRKPYPFRWQRADGGVALFFGQRNNTLLFEIGGKGCSWLSDAQIMTPLLSLVQQRLTRIDIAADIRCETKPEEFAPLRKNKRIKTTSEFNSPSGHTYYVGSKDSELYARVYRFNKPHPRHALLRVEHVLKRKEARAAAKLILEQSVESVCAMVGNRFGWSHDNWRPDDLTTERLPAVEQERGTKSTVFWLHTQVIPAITRLSHEGTLDVLTWVESYLLPEVFPNSTFAIIQSDVVR